MLNLQINFESGGTGVLSRVIEAYGFRTKLALADHLGIASSSLAMRYKRDYFPSDIVVRCMAETGVNLEWLATGYGDKFNEFSITFLRLNKHKLVDGQHFEDGIVSLDRSIFPAGKSLPNQGMYVNDGDAYVVECDVKETYDGVWLIQIAGKFSFRTLTHLPANMVRVNGSNTTFDCFISDITVIGKVIMTIEC